MTFAAAGVGINIWVFAAYDVPHRCQVPHCEGGNSSFSDADGKLPPFVDPDLLSTCTYRETSDCDGIDTTNATVTQCSKSDLVYDHTVVASSASVEFGLVCGSAQWRAWLGTASQFGMLAGSRMVAVVSDAFGRKAGLTVAGMFSLAGAVGCAVAESAVFYGVSRFEPYFVYLRYRGYKI